MSKVKEVQEVQVTYGQLVSVLMLVEKPTFCNVVMKTIPTMNKTGNEFFGRVVKLSSTNFLMGNDYENRVQSNEQKEGLTPDFISEKPSGKTHVSKCVLVDDKTGENHYLMVERFDEIKPQVQYELDGQPMDEIQYELFKQWLKTPYVSTKQEQDRKVMVITPLIKNIVSISFDNKKYIRVD